MSDTETEYSSESEDSFFNDIDSDSNYSPSDIDVTEEEDCVSDSCDELQNEHTEQMQNVELEKDKIDPEWTESRGRHQTFTFTGVIFFALQVDLSPDISPFEAFQLIVDDEMIEYIVNETNRFTEQKIEEVKTRRRAFKKHRMSKWTDTCVDEIKKFFGVLLWMDLVTLGSIENYWSTSPLLSATSTNSF